MSITLITVPHLKVNHLVHNQAGDVVFKTDIRPKITSVNLPHLRKQLHPK